MAKRPRIVTRLIQHWVEGSWFLNALHADAEPVEFIPGPHLSDRDIRAFENARGSAAPWWRLAYLAVVAVQLAAAVVLAVQLVTITATVIFSSQDKAQACKTGAEQCAHQSSAPVEVMMLWAIGCVVVLTVGRPIRRQLAAQMRESAELDAARVRARSAGVVVITGLPGRSRWLLGTADRLLHNYSAELAALVLWDIARRLDAAAVLSRRPGGADAASQLAGQAERDCQALVRATRAGAPFRHQPCRTDSLNTLPRSTDLTTLLADADRLMPAPTPTRKEARR